MRKVENKKHNLKLTRNFDDDITQDSYHFHLECVTELLNGDHGDRYLNLGMHHLAELLNHYLNFIGVRDYSVLSENEKANLPERIRMAAEMAEGWRTLPTGKLDPNADKKYYGECRILVSNIMRDYIIPLMRERKELA